MKRIYLAKKGKRILARLVDVLITIVVTVSIFLIFVLPNTLDTERIEENSNEIIRLYQDSGLFIVDEAGNYNGKSAIKNIDKISGLYSFDCEFNGKTYADVSLTKSLFLFYTTKFTEYGNEFNLSLDTYKSDILKIGSTESNIADYDVNSNKLILIDEQKGNVTIQFFTNIYSGACKNLISNSKINDLTEQNQKIIIESLMYLIPVLLIVSFVLELIIPLFSPCCETIGKHIFKLGVLSSDGYRLKKIWLIPRWLCYSVIEFILGILTFGATPLITYTMFLFCNKRRCLHDFIAKTVVIEKAGSIYFANPKEENYYIQHYGDGE